MRRARILGVINAVPEARDLLLLHQHAFDVLDRIGAGRINRLQNLEDGLVGATVQRAL